MQHATGSVPYFGQWESRDLVATILAEGPKVALPRDPLWQASGARTLDEYTAWASHVCGMACLKMILAARTGRVVPTLELARACTDYGGYTTDPHTGDIKGLVYVPFVQFVAQEFDIQAEVTTRLTAAHLSSLLGRAEFFIASVHPWIRWPEREPPRKGGHLVLVLAADAERIVFHNPSGDTPAAQENASLDLQQFDRFFAGRGIAIFPRGIRDPAADGVSPAPNGPALPDPHATGRSS
jgi:hypothetical protein